MLLVVKNLHQRNGHWAYRKSVPEDLRPIVGKREWTHSLANLSKTDAIDKAAQLNAKYDDFIRSTRSPSEMDLKRAGEDYVRDTPAILDNSRERDSNGYPLPSMNEVLTENLIEPYVRYSTDNKGNHRVTYDLPKQIEAILSVVESGGRYIPASSALSSVYKFYSENHRKNLDDKHAKLAYTKFIEFLGDKNLSAIRRQDVKSWISHCQEKLAHKDTTIKKRLALLSAMTNFYIREFELDNIANPFKNHGISGAHDASQRVPFNRTHLKLIDTGISKSKASKLTKAIITLMKFTGTGPTEAGGLQQRDVILDEKIPFIWVRPNSSRRLKTKERERKIPLHPKAVKALREFKIDNSDKPFWGKHQEPNALSAKLNNFIRDSGVPKSIRLVAYSFRHTLEQALKDSGASITEQKAILGHAKRDITERYGSSELKLETLQKAITKALKKLGDISDSVYEQKEIPSQPKATL